MSADMRAVASSNRWSPAAQARKLADLLPEVFCQDCGKPVEGYRRGRRRGASKFCEACSRERRKRRNRCSARRSYERWKAGGSPRSPGQISPNSS